MKENKSIGHWLVQNHHATRGVFDCRPFRKGNEAYLLSSIQPRGGRVNWAGTRARKATVRCAGARTSSILLRFGHHKSSTFHLVFPPMLVTTHWRLQRLWLSQMMLCSYAKLIFETRSTKRGTENRGKGDKKKEKRKKIVDFKLSLSLTSPSFRMNNTPYGLKGRKWTGCAVQSRISPAAQR